MAVSSPGRYSTVSKEKKTALTNQQQKDTTSYLDIEAFEKHQIRQYAIADDVHLMLSYLKFIGVEN